MINTLRELMADLPDEALDLPIYVEMDEGPMPSGEPGAEDWITSVTLEGASVREGYAVGAGGRYLELKVWHG